MTLAHWAAGSFAGAAAIGSYLGKQVLQKKETRKGLALIHGPLAATGLILLILSAIRDRNRDLILPISLFTGAALGGSYLFSRDISGKKPQRSVTIAHGSLALTAFGFLVKHLISSRPSVSRSKWEAEFAVASIASRPSNRIQETLI